MVTGQRVPELATCISAKRVSYDKQCEGSKCREIYLSCYKQLWVRRVDYCIDRDRLVVTVSLFIFRLEFSLWMDIINIQRTLIITMKVNKARHLF